MLTGLITLLLVQGVGSHAQDTSEKRLPGLDKLPVIKELPDPFLMNDGHRVQNRRDWEARRSEIKEMLLYYEYGHPAPSAEVAAQELASRKVEGSDATERQLLVTIGTGKKVQYHLVLTVPSGTGRFPVIIKGDLCWGRLAPSMILAALSRGYVIAEFDRTEIAPDSADRSIGVHALYPEYDWATIAAWAWGFHRTVEYLLGQRFIDPKRIAVTGHSRGGKAALLAGALDERIALTAPNGSGAGGAGCYRILGEKSEDLEAITHRFPFWFHPRLQEFVGHVDQLPFDQHFLRALVAPRALLSTEALGDLWANPMGTQVSYLAARQVYEFLDAANRTGIHFREGKHEQNLADWTALLDFADLQFFRKKVSTKVDRLPFPDAPNGFSWSAPAK